jgi:hypothetical protein
MQTTRFRASPKNTAAVVVFSAALFSASGAQAILKIGSAATANMSCSNGLCTPTAKTAVLNVGDLENLLASGNVTVTTTGAGVQADDIHVNAALSWSNSNTLSLEARRAVEINAGVSIGGLSGLTLDTGSNGALSFGKVGNITFANLSSNLVINGASYTLVGNIKTLAGDIAGNTSGNFALANNYDASVDGTYGMSPISNVFAGTFEGLGNAISNLSIVGGTKVKDGTYEAFFVEITSSAAIRDFGLSNANISVASNNYAGATLVGLNLGSITSCYATGKVAGGGRTLRSSENGGLVGASGGAIANSYSAARVETKRNPAGGLVAFSTGTISGSYATGPVSSPTAGGLVGAQEGGSVTDSYATGTVTVKPFKNGGVPAGGGLIGLLGDGQGGAATAISNSYATGSVSGVAGSTDVGGLIGINDTFNSTISSSYSTGAVTGGAGSSVGGLIGVDDAQLNTDTYWDTDTSGITNLSQGAGSPANDPGITGLTTAQFQSGLPAGFDPAIWTENSNVNGGLPYLRTNRPPGNR